MNFTKSFFLGGELLIEATTRADPATGIFTPKREQFWIHIALLFNKDGKIVPVNMPVGQIINHGKGYFDPEFIDEKTGEIYVDPKTGKPGKRNLRNRFNPS